MAVKEHQFDISAKLDMQEVKNAVIQAGSTLLNSYFNKISGDDTTKKLMLENGLNEVGKALDELKKDK